MKQNLAEEKNFLVDSKKDDPPQWFIDQATLNFIIRIKNRRLKEKKHIILSGKESLEEFERKNKEIDETICDLQLELSNHKKADPD